MTKRFRLDELGHMVRPPGVVPAVLRAAGGPERSVAVLIALGAPFSSRDSPSPTPPEPGPGPRHIGIG